jgi:lipopolysaccharide transport system ATP-binding protein
MGKMGDVASQGRTVLFVSHNMAAVKALCSEGLVLKGGQVAFRGGADDAIAAYLATNQTEDTGRLDKAGDRSGDGPIRFTNLKVFDPLGQSTDLVQSGQKINIEMTYASASSEKCPAGTAFHIFFSSVMEERLFLCSTQFASDVPEGFPSAGTIRCIIPSLALLPGQYSLEIACVVTGRRITMDRINRAKTLTVIEGDFFGTGKLPPAYAGPFLVQNHWQLVDKEAVAVSAS